MRIRRMVRHEVEQQSDSARMQPLDQPIEIGQRAVHRIDIGVIGDVVAEIAEWRGIDRAQPHRPDTEPFQVIDPLDDAFEVAPAVAIRVQEGDGRDLVEHGPFPPFGGFALPGARSGAERLPTETAFADGVHCLALVHSRLPIHAKRASSRRWPEPVADAAVASGPTPPANEWLSTWNHARLPGGRTPSSIRSIRARCRTAPEPAWAISGASCGGCPS